MLRFIRCVAMGMGVIIWADFICINQNDREEKSWQIMLMRRIYSSATSIIAWIGEETTHIRNSVHYARDLSTVDWELNLYDRDPSYEKQIFRQDESDNQLALMNAIRGIYDILSRPYWHRLWTFQEFFTNDNTYILCGSQHFDGPNLFKRMTGMVDKWYDIIGVMDTLSASYLESDDRKLAHVRKIRKLDKSIRKSFHEIRDLFPEDLPLMELPKPLRYGLHTLLELTCHRNYTEPHDRVYALLGMISPEQGRYPYPPDYDKPVERIMHEATAYIIMYENENENGPRVFSVFPFLGFNSETQLPSWVLNFRCEYTDEDQKARRKDRDDLKYMKPEETLWEHIEGFQPFVTFDLCILQLWARLIGTCHVLKQIPSNPVEAWKSLVQPICLSEGSLLDDLESLGSQFVAAWLRCLDPEKFFSLTDMIESVEDPDDREVTDIILEWIAEKGHRVLGKCAVQISSPWGNTLGIADSSVFDGDMVVVASGIYQPLTLREDLGSREYRIVGKVFISDIIHDEERDQTSFLKKLKQQALEEFRIC